ncbi:MAG: hypothetical protein HQK65_12180 [Desulfamplus sp.]|nr:hypothetical protein [Desulfamplus sp.]
MIKIVSVVAVLLLFCSDVIAEEIPEWSKAKGVLIDCLAGMDLQVTVSGGYETRHDNDGKLVSGPVANALLTVPLYSKKERLDRQDYVNKRVSDLADLYAEVETQSAIIGTLEIEKNVLKKVMIDSGHKGIEAYYTLLKDIEQAKAKKLSAQRKILMILETCGYVAGR